MQPEADSVTTEAQKTKNGEALSSDVKKKASVAVVKSEVRQFVTGMF